MRSLTIQTMQTTHPTEQMTTITAEDIQADPIWTSIVSIASGTAPTLAPTPSTARVYEMGLEVGTPQHQAANKDDDTEVVEAPQPKRARQPRSESTVSKADVVRAWIRAAKAEGRDAQSVIAQAMNELGMTASLAKTYTTNNWNKA